MFDFDIWFGHTQNPKVVQRDLSMDTITDRSMDQVTRPGHLTGSQTCTGHRARVWTKKHQTALKILLSFQIKLRNLFQNLKIRHHCYKVPNNLNASIKLENL